MKNNKQSQYISTVSHAFSRNLLIMQSTPLNYFINQRRLIDKTYVIEFRKSLVFRNKIFRKYKSYGTQYFLKIILLIFKKNNIALQVKYFKNSALQRYIQQFFPLQNHTYFLFQTLHTVVFSFGCKNQSTLLWKKLEIYIGILGFVWDCVRQALHLFDLFHNKNKKIQLQKIVLYHPKPVKNPKYSWKSYAVHPPQSLLIQFQKVLRSKKNYSDY
eukprot:TRINITY_DN8251_c1_g1_i3.p1 TRINITY_DN8251_c1_g1~~TRINITY_DN8251_c1_g1_i3.p1  ORF type:complete len:215 (-),score=-1.10 TRINITY_DN8251_c1_g1_i3:133-777(-)